MKSTKRKVSRINDSTSPLEYKVATTSFQKLLQTNMASSPVIDDDIRPDESISQANFDIIDINIDDGIDGDEVTVQSTIGDGRSSQFTSGTSKKGYLFYIRNECDKEEATMMLKVSPSY